MKLIYLTIGAIPAGWAHEIQIMKMCEAFAENKIEVELVVPWRKIVFKDDPFSYYNIKTKFKITQLPCLDLRPGSPGAFNFWVRLLSFLFFARIYLFFRKYDILYTREQLAGLLFKNINLEIHALPEEAKKWHKKIWQKAKTLIVITSFIKKQLVKSGIEEKKILIASDGVDIKKFQVSSSKFQVRKELGLPLDKKIILYAGSFYSHNWKGVDVLLESVKYFRDDCVLVLVGGEDNELPQIREKYKSPNIILAGRQPYPQIPFYLKAADVLVLPNKKGKKMSEEYTSPLKLFEYMASGRPIVASDLPSIREILNKDNSVLVEPNNPEALAGGIKRVLEDENLAEKISQQAYNDAKKYTWNTRAKSILDFLHIPGKTHVDHLLEHIPNLLGLSIMDLGSGRGPFLIDIAERRGRAIGLELNDAYIKETMARAQEKDLDIRVVKGTAENLPFEDSSFDFVNFAGVIEHIKDPQMALMGLARVLKYNGQAFLSVPNRFGFKDPHFHLYFVNWLPRCLCNHFITLFGKHKDYNGPAGRQNLRDMHYYTFSQIKRLLVANGFEVVDIKEKKLRKIFKNSLILFFVLILYRIYRFLFSESFNFLLKKIK